MSRIHNDCSPINPSGNAGTTNPNIVNFVLPARGTVNIYGVWNGSAFTKITDYKVPGSTAIIANPTISDGETVITGLAENTRSLVSPESPETIITDDDNVKFKGFASETTARYYLQTHFLSYASAATTNGSLTEFYSQLSTLWNMPNLYTYFAHVTGSGNLYYMEFNESKFSQSGYPFELLFGCDVDNDITLTEDNTITFTANPHLPSGTAQNLFAIYDIKVRAVAKLIPTDGSTAMIERVTVGGFAIVETYNSAVLAGTKEVPAGVSASIEPVYETYNGYLDGDEYAHYNDGNTGYDSWFVYGIPQYTTSEALSNLITVSAGGRYEIDNMSGSYVGTGTIIRVYDANDNFVESFRIVIYGDLDNSGSVTSSDSNMATQENKRASWSSAAGRVPYMFRAANVDQSSSFSSSDTNLLIQVNRNKAYIDQISGRAYTTSQYD